jgi:hypothetical protein
MYWFGGMNKELSWIELKLTTNLHVLSPGIVELYIKFHLHFMNDI